jgi:hypothetical protein
MGQAAETESTLVLAENVYVNLPTPQEILYQNGITELSRANVLRPIYTQAMLVSW